MFYLCSCYVFFILLHVKQMISDHHDVNGSSQQSPCSANTGTIASVSVWCSWNIWIHLVDEEIRRTRHGFNYWYSHVMVSGHFTHCSVFQFDFHGRLTRFHAPLCMESWVFKFQCFAHGISELTGQFFVPHIDICILQQASLLMRWGLN